MKYSASPTPNAWVGYGAGFWTNLGDSFGASYRDRARLAARCLLRQGCTIGQYVIIIPSERLVIVRLGRSPNWPPGSRWACSRLGQPTVRRGDRRQGESCARQLTAGAALYCRPSCVAFSTRSNRSSDRIASASWSARPFSTGRASVRNFCCIACASGNEFGSPEGSA